MDQSVHKKHIYRRIHTHTHKLTSTHSLLHIVHRHHSLSQSQALSTYTVQKFIVSPYKEHTKKTKKSDTTENRV